MAQKRAVATLLPLTIYLLINTLQPLAQAQDILRQRAVQQPQPQQQQQQQPNNQNSNSLASIQLPPELASLTPQQLHQLAQLREMQLQQQASQQQAPATSGTSPTNDATTLPTTQPSGSSSGQIPQPGSAASSAQSSNSDNNDRHDDGAYNESGSEMEGVMQPEVGSGESAGAQSTQASPSGGENQAAAQQAPTFEVNWNKCPQLEPSESEKNKKTQVITKCLQSAPIPSNLTRENVESHREQIATCALRVEGWFDDQGNYKYDKAESEIKGKKLDGAIELQVLKFHVACKDEASKKFPRDQNKLIDQVQFYQACMDYYISIVCEIEVSVDQWQVESVESLSKGTTA